MATSTPSRIGEEVHRSPSPSDLCARENSSLPIFRLLPEILEQIFIYEAHEHRERDFSLVLHAPRCANVSYVCRHWRAVALSCPTLWTNHFNYSLRWTEELLARSKQASLKICITHAGDVRPISWWSCLVEKVLSHAERIQELRLVVPKTVFPTELSLSAPRLQVLDISSLWGSCTPPFIINNEDTLPLRILKLGSCWLPWYTFNLNTVTTLSLHYVPSSSQQNVMEFLVTLSCMPALTDLDLLSSLSNANDLSGRAFSVSPEVGLHRLVRLSICDSLLTVVALLSRINIPSETQVKVDMRSGDLYPVGDYALIPPVLARRFSHSTNLSSSSLTIRSLAVRFCSGPTFTMSASEDSNYAHTLPPTFSPWDSDAPLSIDIHTSQSMASPDPNEFRILSDICCSIPSSHVQSLHFVYPPSSSDFWRRTLSHFDGLRRIKLIYWDKGGLTSLLALIAGKSMQAPGHSFVPALEELELCQAMFAHGESAISEEALHDALSNREGLHLTITEEDEGEDAQDVEY